MKDEKTPQENPIVLRSKGHLQNEVHDLGGQPKKEYGSEEKLSHNANLRQHSSVHFSTEYSSEPSNSDMSPKSYVSSSLNTGLTTSSVAQKSSRSSLANFCRTDNMSSGSPSAPVLQKPHFAVLPPQPNMLGEGEDYFHSLFFDSKRRLAHSEFPDRNKTLSQDEANISKSSALGDIKIVEVSGSGLFVKIINSSPDKELAIGDHILQQNVNGHAVSLYRFHPNIRMPANATVTVWAAASKVKHQPPSDFLWKEQDKFRTSPNCTTILCKPNGEAIAWYTPIHWKQAWEGFDTDKKYARSPLAISSPKVQMNRETPSTVTKAKRDQQTTTILEEQVRVFLKREKEIPPSLFPNCSPWGLSQSCPIHPNYSLFRPLTMNNDGSTLCRQSRTQSARPDPIPAPYSLTAGTRRNKNTGHLNHKSGRRSAPSSGRELVSCPACLRTHSCHDGRPDLYCCCGWCCSPWSSLSTLSACPENEEGVQRALNYAMTEFNRGTNDKYGSRVFRVLRVRKQIVAGMKYVFEVVVRRTTCNKSVADLANCPYHENPPLKKHSICHFEVYTVPWLGKTSLLKNECRDA